jgi:dTDP-L-rhamnose 4-epimerase
MPRDTPYSGVAAIFRSSLEDGRAPQVFEDGGQMRDFVHVSDVARANALAVGSVLDAGSGTQVAYNVCSGRPVSILEVAQHVAAGSAGSDPEVNGRYRLGDVRHIVASPELARTELGFVASVAPDEGMRAFAGEPLRGHQDV